MNSFWLYLKYEMKKGMMLIPFFLVSTLLVGGAIVGAAVLYCAFMDSRQLFPKAQVAIVAGSDGSDNASDVKKRPDLQTGLAIGMVQGMESFKTICDIRYMSPKEAAEGLAEGSVDAALYMPDGIYDDINYGTNTPVLIRLSPKQEALSGDMFRQLITDAVSLVRSVEAGIYAVDRASAENPPVTTLGDAEDRLFSVYLKGALGRGGTFSGNGVSLYGSLEMEQFYAVTGVLLLLLLFGIGFASLYNEGEREAVGYLRRKGLGPCFSSSAKIAGMSAALLIMFFVLSVCILAAFTKTSEEALTLAARLQLTLPDAFFHSLRSLPLMLLICVTMALFMHLLYAAFPVRRAALLYLLCVLILFALTGGLLPLPYLPTGAQPFLACTPVPLWQRGIAMILFGGGG